MWATPGNPDIFVCDITMTLLQGCQLCYFSNKLLLFDSFVTFVMMLRNFVTLSLAFNTRKTAKTNRFDANCNKVSCKDSNHTEISFLKFQFFIL